LDNAVAGEYASIVGGSNNAITQNGATGGFFGAEYTVIAGGLSNSIVPLVVNGAKYGVVGGGHGNALSSFNGVIAGGEDNIATGDYAVVPGGLHNDAAGVASFAAVSGSQALTSGAFVWSDDASGATSLKSTGVNQFLVRASGGVVFYSNPTLKSGVVLQPGAGSWSSLSDRASKTNIVGLDPDVVLAKLRRLPISEWGYRTEDAAIRHVGPMAQDFYAVFGVGEDNRHITTIDEDGVALAAMEALNAKNAVLEARVRQLAARYAKLESAVAALLARNK
jgi:hypothetical protein